MFPFIFLDHVYISFLFFYSFRKLNIVIWNVYHVGIFFLFYVNFVFIYILINLYYMDLLQLIQLFDYSI